MTSAELAKEVFSIVEAKLFDRPSPTEFEMAYQARVAIDRIRFAIKVTEQADKKPEQLREAGLQLLDALDRLEAAERSFQCRFRTGSDSDSYFKAHPGINGSRSTIKHGA
jgi:hypothetical protein